MAGLEDLTPAQRQELHAGQILLRKNPEIARKAKLLIKEADPSISIPEVEADLRVQESEKKTAEQIAALEQRVIAQDVEARRAKFREKCKDKGLDPDEVEKIVVAEKCSTETAIRIAEMQQEMAAPGPAEVRHGGSPGPVDMRPDKDWKNLQGGALRLRSATVAREMIDEARNPRSAKAR